LVLAKGRWCSAAGKVTAGLAESNGSLLPSGWLVVTCGMTACTLRSAAGPMLSNEYGKPLPFLMCMVLLPWSEPLWEFTYVHLVSADSAPGMVTNPQTKPTDLSCESATRT